MIFSSSVFFEFLAGIQSVLRKLWIIFYVGYILFERNDEGGGIFYVGYILFEKHN